MRIAVLGTGEVGGVLGRRWADQGHQIYYGSRTPHTNHVQQLVGATGHNARALSLTEATTQGEVLVLATPWESAQQVIESLGDITGKVLIDCTNPVSTDFRGLDVGHTTSAAERIARWAEGARVVKAFNSVSVAAMANPVFGGQRATMFCCGDDREANALVCHLAEELGFDAVDAGPLQIARYIEPFAMLFIQLAIKEGWGGDCALKIMTR